MTAAWVPDACTLPTIEQPLRVKEFRELFAAELVSSQRLGPTRLRITLRPGCADRVRDLTVRESQCCSFFTFTIRDEAERVVLDVEVPAAQQQVLDALAAR
jgi:hypothetical protein